MATPPFAPAFEANLKISPQGGVLRLLGNHQVWPQYFCCISGNTVGVLKVPVVIMEVSATEVCTFSPITVDISRTYSATSTLVTYSVDFRDGNVVNGAWPPAGPIAHPLGGYQLPGTYDIEASATDLLGTVGSSTIQIEAFDCIGMMLPSEPIIGFEGDGVYYTANHELEGAATIWQDLNEGLEFPGAKYAYCLLEHTYPDGRHALLMPTRCGIYEYRFLPAGEGRWYKGITNEDISGYLGIPVPELRIWDLQLAADMPGWGYASIGFGAPPPPIGTHFCAVVHTRDYFRSFMWVAIVSTAAGSSNRSEVAISQHSMGTHVWVAFSGWAGSELHSSAMSGFPGPGSWFQMDVGAGTDDQHVHVPYVNPGWDDSYVFWQGNTVGRYSTDGGFGFANYTYGLLRTMGQLNQSHYTPGQVEWCNWRGVGPDPSRLWYSTSPGAGKTQFGPQWSAAGAVSSWDQCVLSRNPLNGLPLEWMWFGTDWYGYSVKVNTVAGQTEHAGNLDTLGIVTDPFTIMHPAVEQHVCPACGV